MSGADQSFAERSTRSQVARLRRVAEQAVGEYPFEVARMRLILHAFNTTFRVDTTDGRTFALRINVNSRRDDEHLAAEAAWLAALAADPVVVETVSVPAPVPTRSGSLRTSAWSDDLDRELPVLVMTWLPGRNLGDPEPDGAFALGAAMATLHDHAAGWSLPAGAQLPDVDEPLHDLAAVAIADRTVTTAEQRTVFAATYERVASAISELRADRSVTFLPIHADLHGGNLKWLRKRVAVFDFDDACIGTRVHDLAISAFYLRRDERAEAAMLEGYASVRPLPPYTPDQLEAIVAGRNLLLVGDVLNTTTAEIRAMAPEYTVRSARRLQTYLDTGRFHLQVA